MKILYIRTSTNNPKQLYAIDYYAIETSKRKGYQVWMLGSQFTHQNSDEISFLNEYPAFQKKGFGFVFIKRFMVLVKIIYRLQPQIIHMQNHIGDFICLFLARLLNPGCKVILDIRSLSTDKAKNFLLKHVFSFLTSWYDHVFVLNKTIKKIYTYPGATVSCLPVGYDSGIFYSYNSSRVYLAGEFLRCIYIGVIQRMRGLETLIKAVVGALKAGAHIELHLIGEGKDVVRLKSFIPLKYKNRVVFHSFMEHKAVGDFLRGGHLGLAYVPKTDIYDQNMPLKTIEMLASGLPVIATNTAGNRQLVAQGKSGWLIEEDPDEIAGLLFSIWKNGFRKDMQQEAKQAVTGFSWPNLAATYLYPVYESRTVLEDNDC